MSQSPSQPCLQLQEVWLMGRSLDAPLFRPLLGVNQALRAANVITWGGLFGRQRAVNIPVPSASLFAVYS